MQQQCGSLKSSGAVGGAAQRWTWHWAVMWSNCESTRKQQRASTESSVTMVQAVQGGDLGCDSNSCGPTDELRSKCLGCSTPSERGVVDSDVQRSLAPQCAVQQCSGWSLWKACAGL